MKRALLVGINYPGTSSQLNGCVNDVILMASLLIEQFGFTDPLNRRLLVDNAATTSEIMRRLDWLVDGAKAGDTLYFHYSGHGSQMIDTDYDLEEEPDGKDEIICPSDLNWRDKVIKDDDLRRVFSRVPKGVDLTVTLDCCHSGQGLRTLTNPYETPSPNKSRTLPMPADIEARGWGKHLQVKTRGLQNVDTIEEQDGVLISGCQSTQTSADAWINNKYHGACTYYLWETLRQSNYNISHVELIKKMNEKMDYHGYTQNPELNCASQFLNKRFLK
jgi:hypothetical protein